jgi:Na+-transporting NADH:ubiquinone oxidoreductase subunit NqrB
MEKTLFYTPLGVCDENSFIRDVNNIKYFAINDYMPIGLGENSEMT